MTQRPITRLRHVDLAVPDHAKHLGLYTGEHRPIEEGEPIPLRLSHARHRPRQRKRHP